MKRKRSIRVQGRVDRSLTRKLLAPCFILHCTHVESMVNTASAQQSSSSAKSRSTLQLASTALSSLLVSLSVWPRAVSQCCYIVACERQDLGLVWCGGCCGGCCCCCCRISRSCWPEIDRWTWAITVGSINVVHRRHSGQLSGGQRRSPPTPPARHTVDRLSVCALRQLSHVSSSD